MSQTSASIIRGLNPADHFTLAMDEQIRKEGMSGNLCGIALELGALPDIHQLGERIDQFCRSFPTAGGRLVKRGRRFYWCRREGQAKGYYVHPDSGVEEDVHAGIQNVMNRKEARENLVPLEFHLFPSDDRSILLIRWIHPFCDAVGVDLIARYLAADRPPAENESKDRPVSILNEQLARFNFRQKIALLWKAKSWIEEIDRLRSILPNRDAVEPRKLNFSIFRFTVEQSRQIAEQSRRQVGLIGTNLYYIGCVMRALEKMPTRSEGQAYCAPYAFNLRKQKALEPVTGNHVGALFAQAPVEIVRSRERLFGYLIDQYRKAVRDQFDYAFFPLMWAAQWMSLERYGKTLRESYRGGQERSSFWFSDVGQSELADRKVFGAPVLGVFHLCQVSTPPGLAVLSCTFRGRLSLTYNFIEPLFDDDWVQQLHREMMSELLGVGD